MSDVQHAEWCDGNGRIDCWDCGGEGGFHDCGEDSCCCLDPELNEECATCEGNGVIRCAACKAADDEWNDYLADKADANSY